jgi:hypothetical protein
MRVELTMTSAGVDHAERVVEILRTRCSAAGRVCELATVTGLAWLEVIDARYELAHSGRVTPTVWRLADEPQSQKAFDRSAGGETMGVVEATKLADSDSGWYVIEERLEDGRVILRPETEVEAMHRENGSRPATNAEVEAFRAEHGSHMLPADDDG